jgi:hypothetical protein
MNIHKEKGTDKGRVQRKLLGDVDTFVLPSGDESDGHVAPRHDVCLSVCRQLFYFIIYYYFSDILEVH